MPIARVPKGALGQKPSGVNNQYILVSCMPATSSPAVGSPESLGPVFIYFAPLLD